MKISANASRIEQDDDSNPQSSGDSSGNIRTLQVKYIMQTIMEEQGSNAKISGNGGGPVLEEPYCPVRPCH